MCYTNNGGEKMESLKFQRMLEQIARRHNTTVEEVRCQMQLSMDEAQKCSDPAVQARWNAIPRKGAQLTLEEFVDYMAQQVPNGTI